MTMTSGHGSAAGHGNSEEQGGAGEQAAIRSAKRIVVGVDDSPAGLAAVRLAVSLARTAGVPIVAVRAWALGLPRHGGRRHRLRGREHPHVILYFDAAEERRECGELVLKAFRAAVGGQPQDVAVTIETPEGDPGLMLTEIATAKGDILVVGRERGQLMKHLVHGSVSSYCCEHAQCPVLVVPPAEGAPR